MFNIIKHDYYIKLIGNILISNILLIVFCGNSFASASNDGAIANSFRKNFYKSERSRNFFSGGGGYISDENSKEYRLHIGHEYKSKLYNSKIEINHTTEYFQPKKKPEYKKEELYDIEILAKWLIDQKNRYYINYLNHTKYDSLSSYYYDMSNAFGIGKMILQDSISFDINIGYNHVKEYNSELFISPTLGVKYKFNNNVSISAKGFLFLREDTYNEELRTKLSFRLNKNVLFSLVHKYEKYRYIKKLDRVNKIDRSLIFLIKYRI